MVFTSIKLLILTRKERNRIANVLQVPRRNSDPLQHPSQTRITNVNENATSGFINMNDLTQLNVDNLPQFARIGTKFYPVGVFRNGVSVPQNMKVRMIIVNSGDKNALNFLRTSKSYEIFRMKMQQNIISPIHGNFLNGRSSVHRDDVIYEKNLEITQQPTFNNLQNERSSFVEHEREESDAKLIQSLQNLDRSYLEGLHTPVVVKKDQSIFVESNTKVEHVTPVDGISNIIDTRVESKRVDLNVGERGRLYNGILVGNVECNFFLREKDLFIEETEEKVVYSEIVGVQKTKVISSPKVILDVELASEKKYKWIFRTHSEYETFQKDLIERIQSVESSDESEMEDSEE